VSFGSTVTVTGGLVTSGALTAPANKITGTVVATNGATYGGTTPPADVETSLPISMLHYLPYYFYDGKRYTAKKLPQNITGGALLDSNTTTNPCNVWYSDVDVSVLMATTCAGTVVTTNGKGMAVYGALTITPVSGMPGLVIDKSLTYQSNGLAVKVYGPTYIGTQVKSAGTSTTCSFLVEGTLLSGTSGWVGNGSYKGTTTLKYVAAQAKAKGFADELEKITTLTIQSWEIENGRPQ
jgi:hypothetical protein